MIPKVIHYCWLSDTPMPMIVRHCIASWKKTMPDYDFKLWDKDAFDIESVTWVREACSLQQWAFAADYIRLYALYNFGGIYFDTDVFVRKPFDCFLENDLFSSMEYHKRHLILGDLDENGHRTTKRPVCGVGVQAAVIGSVPQHPFLKEVLDFYERRPFINPDGSLYQVICPSILSIGAEDYGFRYKDEEQDLKNGIKIYRSDKFAGAIEEYTRRSYAIHLKKRGWIERSFSGRVAARFLSLYEKIMLKIVLGR